MSLSKKLFTSLSVAALSLSGCSTMVPDLRATIPVEGYGDGVVALWQQSNTDDAGRMNVIQWLDFIYAQPRRPDPNDLDCVIDPKAKNCTWLPAKGPAVCVSSEDWARNETALAQLCIKGKCTYEQKKALERMQNLSAEANKGEKNGSTETKK